jgi:hypothetical protein
MENTNNITVSNDDKLIPKQYETNNGYKITIITIVLLTIFLLFLGINIFYIIINLMILTGDFFVKSISIFGYVSGSAINETTLSIANVSKTGIDITTGAVHSAGNIIKSISKPYIDNTSIQNIDKSTSDMKKITPTQLNSINEGGSPTKNSEVTSNFQEPGKVNGSSAPSNKKENFSLLNNNFFPNLTNTPEQNSANSKESWCLIGSPDGIRNCVSVKEYDKCASSQIYPSKKECMNPLLMAK